MNYRKLLVDSGKRLLNSRLTVETWGNISVRHNDRVYITPSGMDYTSILESDIVMTDMEGNILEGTRRPSIELGMHLAVLKARPEASVVIHTHAIHSNIFACTGEDIPLFHDEGAQALGDIVKVAPYALPGTAELAQVCVDTLGTRANSCLLRNHGAVCVGKDMDSCFRVAAVLEMVAEIYYKIKAMNCSCIPLDSKSIDIMQEFVRTKYGQPNE